MHRRLAGLGATIALGLIATAAPVVASSPTAGVTGNYTYTTFTGGHREVTLSAKLSGEVSGFWSAQSGGGPVTCLVVDGNEAWLAGTGTTGPDTGAFIHVVDGGAPGSAYDLVTAWFQDPGQPFEELQGWCEDRATHVPLFDVDTGNVTVKSR